MRFGFVVEIGDRQLRAHLAEGLGAAVGNRMLVGDADHQSLFIFKNRSGNLYFHFPSPCVVSSKRRV